MLRPYQVPSHVTTDWIHNSSERITCGATVGSEANEKLEVKAKADNQSTFGTKIYRYVKVLTANSNK